MLRPTLTVRKAQPVDAPTPSEILQAAAEWLLGKDIHQWRPEWFDVAWAEDQVANETLYLGLIDDRAVATLQLLWEDREVWGPQSPDAGYVHSLAVRRPNAGMGAALLDWAVARVHDAGRSYLRLDCWDDNTRLRSYYENLGFLRVDSVEQRVGDRHWRVSRFQKRCNGQGEPAA